ncbi:MAG: prepilin-type N-terminal cleavage/methylation domain-containing protein [Hyphomicrobium sp.]|nr:prepilin-type N-terminal cleavage/methylation domain-containing protein [Hyphomicrobium sp.]
MMSPEASGGEQGFTLVEAIIVLVIAAFAMSLAPGIINLGQRAVTLTASLKENSDDYRALDAALSRIAAARREFARSPDGLSRLAFRGEPSRIQFVTEFSNGPNGGGLYSIELEHDQASAVLIMTLEPYPAHGRTAGTRTALLRAQNLALRYFGFSRMDGDRRWMDSWNGSGELPSLVEVTLTLPDGKGALEPIVVAIPLSN